MIRSAPRPSMPIIISPRTGEAVTSPRVSTVKPGDLALRLKPVHPRPHRGPRQAKPLGQIRQRRPSVAPENRRSAR